MVFHRWLPAWTCGVRNACIFGIVNYLGHFFLSFGSPELLHGQFIADAVKGKTYLNYPLEIQHGIMLHRFVDDFTDSHPATSRLRALIRPELGLFSPVAIDLFFDHVLAKTWDQWHTTSLYEFAEQVTSLLLANVKKMPFRMQQTLYAMKNYHWLTAYASEKGIEQSFRGMSRRVTSGERLLLAPAVLSTHFTEINNAFMIFFPEIIRRAQSKLDTFTAGSGLNPQR